MTRSLTRRLPGVALVSLASMLFCGATALAQDDGGDPVVQVEEAEKAFLRAVYHEVGEADPAAALEAYDRLLARWPDDAAVAPRAHVARLRCLRALGRHDEAAAVVQMIERRYRDRQDVIRALRSLPAATPATDGSELEEAVRRALRDEKWHARASAFGNVAVPVLAHALRAVDPELVERAATSLLLIGTDDASDALLAAFDDDSVAYPAKLVSGILWRSGLYPERLGEGIAAMPPSEVRDSLILNACLHSRAGAWLTRAFVADPAVRALVFARATPWPATASLLTAAFAAGAGAARDDALAYVRRLDDDAARTVAREPLTTPPVAVREDAEVLDTLALSVYANVGSPESVEVRDALLRSDDPAVRAIGLRWTWMNRIEAPSATLLTAALRDYDWPTDNQGAILGGLFRSCAGKPDAAFWKTVADHAPASVPYRFLAMVAGENGVTTAGFDRYLEAGHGLAVLSVLHDHGVRDAPWAARVLPALLGHEDEPIRRSAALLLARLHAAGHADLTAHADALARAMPRLELRKKSGPFDEVFEVILSMGDVGARALANSLDPGRSRGWDELMRLHLAGRAEAAEVALEWVRGVATIDLEQKAGRDALNTAVTVLADARGDAVVEALIAAWDALDGDWSRTVIETAMRVEKLSSEGAERLLTAALERLGSEAELPDASGPLTGPAQRRVALAALLSPHPRAQASGARWQGWLLDPDATQRLAELAESGTSDVASAARRALAAHMAAERQMVRVRAVAERKKTTGRVRVLLASDSARERMAGIAGVVALRLPDAIERLLDVAATDGDPEVAAEARRALMALGGSGADEPATE